MKKTLLILSILVLCKTAIGQITLGAGDFPTPGLTLTYLVANDSVTLQSLVSLGSPGANGVYNLTGAAPLVNDTMVMNWVSPANTPFPTQHPLSNVAVMWKAFVIFGDTSAWQYAFYNSDATGLYTNGASVVFDTLYFSTLVHGPLAYYSPTVSNDLEMMSSNYVLGYNYHDSLKSHILLESPPPLVIASKVELDVLVDGWGSLTTPFGTYQVIRVKQMRLQAEAFIQPADTLTNFPYEESDVRYQYVFYAKGIGSTVAVVDYTNAGYTKIKSVRYINTGPFTSINDNNMASDMNLTLYPNPVSDIFTIDISGEEQISKVEITNSLGELIQSIAYPTSKEINLSQQNSGMYFIRIDTKTNSYFRKLIKQ